MQITRGIIPKPQKVVIYGPEGIGKSTFASHFPDVLFIDTEDSTVTMPVARLPKPTSWTMLREEVRYVRDNPTICKTLAIDTLDWAERLCLEEIITNNQVKSIGDIAHGRGYVILAEEFGRFLNDLTDVIEKGIHVVCTAHAMMRKFEKPDELGSYDRWELKLQKKVSPLVKEWSDLLLFANYETNIVTDSKTKSRIATGGSRVMYTTHHPAWDAKNRITGMPDELPFAFASIEPVIHNVAEPSLASIPNPITEAAPAPVTAPPPKTEQVQMVAPAPIAEVPLAYPELPDAIPKKVRDLMEMNRVTVEELQRAIGPSANGGFGYFPGDMPITEYPLEFYDHIAADWNGFMMKITDFRPLPFEL